MQEEKKDSKLSENNLTIQDRKSGILLDIIKSVMKNQWGMRISLGVLGVLLFFIGYIAGNWNVSHLESEIKNRESDVKQCKTATKKLQDKLTKAEEERNALQNKLSESKEKINFIQQREKIRKPLNAAVYSWKNRDAKDTVEKIYAALINLKIESRSSLGLSKFFYTTVIKRLNQSISLINTACESEVSLSGVKPEVDGNKTYSSECNEKIMTLISSCLDVLPPPRD